MSSNASGDAPSKVKTECQNTKNKSVLEEAYNSWLSLGDLRNKGLFYDVVLKTQDGNSYPAHRMVLCVCGEYFRAMFSGRWQSSEQREIIIPGVTGRIMEQILMFAYCLKVELSSIQETKELLIVTNHLGVEGVVQRCIKYLQQNIDYHNCIDIYDFARTYYCQNLITTSLKFILENIVEVALAPSTDNFNFRKLSYDDLFFILKSDELNVKDETVTAWLILRWISADIPNRLKHLRSLFPLVRLLNKDHKFLNSVFSDRLLQLCYETKEQVSKYFDPYEVLPKSDQNVDLNGNLVKKVGNFKPRFPQSILLVVGGWCQNSPTDTNEIYEPRSRRWQVATRHFPNLLKFSRAYHAVLFMEGWVYIVGGLDGVVTMNSCERYNLATAKWEQMCGMHCKRCYVGVACLDGFLYAVGGANGNADETRLKSAEKFDPKLNIWTQLPDMYEGRSDAGVTSLDKRIYVVGGFNGRKCLFSVEYFDTELEQWSGISPMRVSRSGVSAVAYQGRIIVLGGYDGRVRLSTVEVYDPVANRWGVMPPMLTERSNFSSCVLEDKLHVMGGFDGSSTCSNVEYYDDTNVNNCDVNFEFEKLEKRAEYINDQCGKEKGDACPKCKCDGVLSKLRCCFGTTGHNNQFNTAYTPSHSSSNAGKWVKLPNMVVSRSALSCCVVTGLEPSFLNSVVNSLHI